MIEVEESETLQMLRSSVREFALKEIMPVAAKMDEEDYFPVDIFKKMGKLGYLGITIPERYGGSGMGYAAQAVI
ncbi:MAG: acyl-CoA dehydrogenase family protein, partial [Candidatus Thermoplasmatota archaeon]|nr:acyl-CoA dehydrogenase family protein [Candidatus Thermoplasmatota archaeon]